MATARPAFSMASPTSDSFNSNGSPSRTNGLNGVGGSAKKAIPTSASASRSKENKSNGTTPVTFEFRTSSPSKVRQTSSTMNNNTSPSLMSQIKLLEKRRNTLEDEGKYLEAQAVHEQICQLKISEEAKRRDSLRQTRKSQLQTLEELYEEELQTVIQKWETEMREFEKKVEQGLLEMQERHERALTAYRARGKAALDDAMQAKFPPSKRLLEMRRTEKALARQHEYKQANDMKIAADALEEQEANERLDRVKQGIMQGEERVKERLRNELAVFEQRNSLIRATMLENRRQDEDTLLQRFQNRKSDMVSATSRVEVQIDKRMEYLSPTRPALRPKYAPGSASSFVNE